MMTLSDLIQYELNSLAQALEDLRKEVADLRAEKNRLIMVGRCIRVEGNRCELQFARDDSSNPQRSGLVPWVSRAGADYQQFQAPSVGEQGLLLHYGEGDSLNAGVALFGIRSNKHPLPTLERQNMVLRFTGGAELVIDKVNGQSAIQFEPPELTLTVPDELNINTSKVTINGKLKADNIESSGEIRDKARSLSDIVGAYNRHGHGGNGTAPPAETLP